MRYLTTFIFLCFLHCINAQDTISLRTYVTDRIITHEVELDGRLDDEAWNLVEWGEDFTVRQPNNGDEPQHQTKFKLLYDDQFLYVAYRCYHDDPSKIESRLARRDRFPGDWIEIHIDSYNDNSTAYSFTISASGVKSDEFITNNGRNWDTNWNPIWYGKAKVDTEGWTAEIKIPLSQLRFGKQEKHTWGFNINRKDFSADERSTWQFVPQNVSGYVSNFAHLEGIKSIKPKRQIEIQPYVTTSLKQSPSEAGNPFADGSSTKLNVGVDGKIGITNDFTLDFSINPDFGQVEADPSRLTLDGFQIFFDERRPFFIENANIFSRDISNFEAGGPFGNDNLFYSRRIGARPSGSASIPDEAYTDRPGFTSILGAAKFSGKTKKGLSIGILESITAEETTSIDQNGQRSTAIVEPLTNYFVGAVNQDFREGKTQIGGTITAVNRRLGETGLEDQYHDKAYTGGINLLHTWKEREWQLKGNFIYSAVSGTANKIADTQTSFEHYFQRPDASHLEVDRSKTSLTGHGGAISLANYGGKDNISFESGLTWRSAGIELNDIGFLNTADQIDHATWAGYQAPKPFGIFRRYRLNYNHYLRWTYGGEHLYSAINMNTHAGFTNFWSAGGGATFEFKDISTKALFGGPKLRQNKGIAPWFYVQSDSRKKVTYGFNVQGFRSVGIDKGALQVNSIGIFATYQPTDALRLSISPRYFHQNRAVQNVSLESFKGEDRYVTGRVIQKTLSMSMRVNYSLTPTITFEYWGQPFVSKGNYSAFKYITDPLAIGYKNRFHLYTPSEISSSEEGSLFYIDEDLDGITDYSFESPDFNFLQFRSNLVFRWEYRPNSELFVVWTQGKTNSGDTDKGLWQSLSDDLFGEEGTNTFLVKMTYRFY